MGKKKDKKNPAASQIAKLLSASKKKMREAKFEKKKYQCDCQHGSEKGKVWLRPIKDGGNASTLFKCKECKDKVDFGIVFGKSPKEIRKEVKRTCNDFMNLCNVNKVTLNPKVDIKYAKLFSKAQFMAYKVKKISQISLADSFEPNKKKNRRGGKGKKKNFSLSGGGANFR